MTPISSTALEEAADRLRWLEQGGKRLNDWSTLPKATKRKWCDKATAAITAYLAQAGKEGWVMVRGTEVDDMRSALKGLSDMYGSTWDRVDGGLMMIDSGVERFEKAHQRAYEVLYPDRPLISFDEEEAAAAQNGGE